MKNLKHLLIFLTIFSFVSPGITFAQEAPQYPTEIIRATYFDTTPPLRDMELIEPGIRKREWKDNVIKNHMGFKEDIKNMPPPKGPDPVIQDKNGSKSSRNIGANFDGVSNLSGVAPPDTDGDVGPNHYMQMVNLAFAIYDKNGSLLYGPADNSTIWDGFVGSWTGTNDGDPIVLYDEQADRWMASQFAISTSDGSQWMLVAISQTADPLGSWHRYAFEFTYMPDYPKFGIWPDGYYLSVNQFEKVGSSYTWKGAGACALNRDKMIAGDASAEMVFFNLGTAYGSLLPADFDGPTPPPDGAPNYFTAVEPGVLQLWELNVDWANTSNSTITKKPDISVSSYSTGGFTINQPGTSQTLDNLADRLMYRLQYRNFDGYQAMVTNHTVNNGSGSAAVRWYELRKTGSSWGLHQEGTYSPDSDHRWMGSIAMNSSGDIAIGYSVSSSTTYPSIRFAGRNNGDPLGQMTFIETSIFEGTSSQSGVSRWGDYSMMSVDPENDLTFWFTTEYTSGSWNWRTRIASFDITPLGPNLKYLSHSVDDSQGNNNGKIDPGETVNLEITVQNNGSENMNNVTGILSESSTYITVTTSQPQSFGNIAMQGTSQASFTIIAAGNTPVGEVIEMLLHLEATGGHSFDDNFDITVGQPDIVIIDLDGTKTSGPNMEASIENLGHAVDYTTSIPSSLSAYNLAFVCLGIYSENHILNSTEGQTLADFVNGGGKLYMEGGDTWNYDSQTTAHSLFNIDGTADGTGDLGTILGQSGTFTSGMSFSYTSQNEYIDHLEPISPAFTIFANQTPAYGCAVAHDADSYKTIGTSFEFGGMGSTTNQDEVMEKYLEFFEMIVQPGTPEISVNPQSLNQSLTPGQTSSQTISISNTGSATLDFSTQIDYLNPEIGWMEVSPTSGNISATLSQQLSVDFNASGLDPGTYTANILVNSNDPENAQVEIPVTLEVFTELIADFEANVTTIFVGESVDFTDMSVGGPTNWNWSFTGSATPTSTAQNPGNIVYNNAGAFNVSLTIYKSSSMDTETKSNYITVNVVPQVIADFEANTTTIYEGESIDYTDLSTGGPTNWNWSFEGAANPTSTAQNPGGIVYNNAGIFNVSLTIYKASSSDTETKTDYISVNVIPYPVADFDASETVIYQGTTIDFTDLSINNPTSWAWTFEGAETTSSNLQNPNGIVYNTTGSFDVSLSIANGFGTDTETKTDFITVNVIPLPVAEFESSETIIYERESINFTDLSTNNPTSWVWTFEGAETASSVLQNPGEIVYNSGGTFDVTLTVTNNFGTDTETKTEYITVNVIPIPVADFEVSETIIYQGESVDFNDLSTNNPTSWAWSFEGAETTSSLLRNPTGIAYNSPGVFDVSLTVTNDFGTDSKTKTDYITVNVIPLPVADFEAGETVIYQGGSINFTDLSSNDPTSWVWTFEGSETASSNLQYPAGIVYNTIGDFDVTLTITNAFGSDTETKTDYISVNVIPLPVADFEADETVIYQGGSIDFTDLSTNDPTSWAWNFEGAETTSSNLQNPAGIVYNSIGTFDVALAVSNEFGSDTETKTDFVTVNVIPLPVADFEASETMILQGGSINFTDLSTNNPTSWAWTFEGVVPASSNLQNPTGVIYNTPGFFDVTLTVINEFGTDSKTKEAYIEVEEVLELIANFNSDVTTVDEGDVVHFYDASTGNPTSWEWEIEGGSPSVSYQQDPVVIFNLAGTYNVKLIATGPNGSDEELKEEYIVVNEVVSLNPPGWEVVPTGSQHIIAVPLETNPRIFEVPIQPGDFVGVFYIDDSNQLKCGGATAWTGTENIAVIAFGNDIFSPVKNGFDVGEEFQWRIYSASEEMDYPAKADYNEALFYGSTFYPLGMSGITDLFAGVKFEILVKQGWSGISSPIMPWNSNIEDIFSTSFSNLILMNNFEGMLWPDQSINTLVNWDNQGAYNIKVNSDIIVEFKGDAEENFAFDIQPGWSFLPVPVACEVNTAELFSGHEDEMTLLREISGFNVYWPQYNINTLEHVVPGMAYMLLANEAFPLEFVPCDVPLKNTTPASANNISLNPAWGTINGTHAVHTIAIAQDALNDLSVGDVIGIFNSNGQCYGQAQYTGQPVAISVFGDDVSTNFVDGFETNEHFQLLLHKASENTSIELEAVFDMTLPNSDQFIINGISAITDLKLSSNGINQTFTQNIIIQPNPSNGIFHISGIEMVDKISILSPEGHKIYESLHDGNISTRVDISKYSKGIYLIRFESNDQPEIRKLIIN